MKLSFELMDSDFENEKEQVKNTSYRSALNVMIAVFILYFLSQLKGVLPATAFWIVLGIALVAIFFSSGIGGPIIGKWLVRYLEKKDFKGPVLGQHILELSEKGIWWSHQEGRNWYEWKNLDYIGDEINMYYFQFQKGPGIYVPKRIFETIPEREAFEDLIWKYTKPNKPI